MKYRAEIDGLRTLAVLPVVLFHAGVSIFSGGFVGVDIFFVISGYLITTILIDELARGEFSILRFYERRARRILPALFFVILCSIPPGWILLDPARFTDFAQSILATMAFVSNILFWRESGYFDTDAENKPLLHTWSLAVEEQYYLFFPVMLFLLWRFGRGRTLWVIVALAVASLGIAEWGSRHAASANFYLLPSRMWELFAGSICAFTLPRLSRNGHQALSAIGLGLILAAIVLIDGTMRYPSLITLAPVLGTVLIILFARGNTWAARLLSLRPMVWGGLISYSLYLWHQPILAFARIRLGEERAGQPVMIAVFVGFAILLSVLSWRFVEQPFRRIGAGLLPRQRGVFGASLAGIAAFAAFGLFGVASNGAAFRFPPGYASLLAGYDDHPDHGCEWGSQGADRPHPVAECLRSVAPGAVPDVLIFGDSHAWAASEDIAEALGAEGLSSYIATMAGCPPVPGIVQYGKDDPNRCSAFATATIDWARSEGIKSVVVVARFAAWALDTRFDNGEGGVEPERTHPVSSDTKTGRTLATLDPLETRQPRLQAALRDGLAALGQEFHVTVVEPIPEAGWHVLKRGMAKMKATGSLPDLGTSYARYHARADAAVALLREVPALAPPGEVNLVRVDDLFCHEDTGRCDNIVGGVPLYIDDDHLSRRGARLIAPRIVEAVLAGLDR